MHLSLLASLDPHCRQRGAELLSGTHPDSVIVVHDLLDDGLGNSALVLRRIYRQGELQERSSGRLEHGCLSCTVRLDLVPTVRRLIREGVPHAVLALPPGVEPDMVVEALYAGLEEAFCIDNAVLALDPAELEDQLWDRRGLSALGLTSYPKDPRTQGEFLVGTLAQADTVLPSPSLANALIEAAHPQRALGLELLHELAPHAAVALRTEQVRPGCFDLDELMARQAPGEVRVAEDRGPGVFRTVRYQLQRPLHPERFRAVLPELAAGSCWVRGRLWLASTPERRIAVRGIGPRLWLENTGDWLPGIEQPGSVLALTGRADELIESEVHDLLDSAQLSLAEAGNRPEYFDDPFGLDSRH
ncbi:MAG: GTP-binding protein [Renibacterium sp.]|nr:GTP-binding protein [Renibacterium sp.]